jgi:hypothetical protein
MSDDPIDLSPLDPASDPERFERLIGAIRAQVAPVLAMSARRRGVIEQIAAWRTPMLVAAAVVVAASAVLLVGARGAAAVVSGGGGPHLAEAVGVPAPVAEWMRRGELPTSAELLDAFGEPVAGRQP